MTAPGEGGAAENRLSSLSERRRAVALPVRQIVEATGISRPQVFRALRGKQCSIRTLTAVEREIVKAEAQFLRRFAAAQRRRREEGWPDATE